MQLQQKSSAQMQLVLPYHLDALLQPLQPHRQPPLPQQQQQQQQLTPLGAATLGEEWTGSVAAGK